MKDTTNPYEQQFQKNLGGFGDELQDYNKPQPSVPEIRKPDTSRLRPNLATIDYPKKDMKSDIPLDNFRSFKPPMAEAQTAEILSHSEPSEENY